MPTSLAVADGFTQFVAHVLAHVPLAGPGNLWDPGYIAWAAAHLGADDQAMLNHDAQLLARLWAADPQLDGLHGTFELFADLEQFVAASNRPLADLTAADVAAPQWLAALKPLPAAELVHASMAAQLPGILPVLAAMHDLLTTAATVIGPWCDRMCMHVPELAGRPVELVFGLGHHGRALPRRILIGIPAPWNSVTPARAAILAGHEALVQASGHADYAASERWALATMNLRIQQAEPALAQAHRDWLNSLDLSQLGQPG